MGLEESYLRINVIQEYYFQVIFH